MEYIKSIVGALTNDPYWVGRDSLVSHFLWRTRIQTKTEAGFHVTYTIVCEVDKRNTSEFKAAGLLNEKNQEKFLIAWHEEVFMPAMKRLGITFSLIPKFNLTKPSLCRFRNETDTQARFFDPNCAQTIEEIRKVQYLKHGCQVTLFKIELELTPKNIRENYLMIDLQDSRAMEGAPEMLKQREAAIITFLNTNLELQKEFQILQTNQEHGGSIINVRTRLAGKGLEISWGLQGYENSENILYGFRKEDGFPPIDSAFDGMGTAIIETARNGQMSLTLAEGKEYFFTFLYVANEPTESKGIFSTAIREMRSVPNIKGKKATIVDALRFSVRMPSREEIAEVERKLNKAKSDGVHPQRLRTQEALEELALFVEFEEAIGQFERNLIEQIRLQSYSAEEKASKIERVKSVVEKLRIDRM